MKIKPGGRIPDSTGGSINGSSSIGTKIGRHGGGTGLGGPARRQIIESGIGAGGFTC
jgi:hypothetical protein